MGPEGRLVAAVPGPLLVVRSIFIYLFYFLIKKIFIVLRHSLTLLLRLGWSVVVQSQLTAVSTSWVRVILLPQPPE